MNLQLYQQYQLGRLSNSSEESQLNASCNFMQQVHVLKENVLSRGFGMGENALFKNMESIDHPRQ